MVPEGKPSVEPGLNVDSPDWDDAFTPFPCDTCGDPEGRDAWSQECKNHGTWVKCPDCEAIFQLGAGTFDPGTRDVYYLPNGDPGYPGDPPEIYCPGCDGPSEEPEVVVQ